MKRRDALKAIALLPFIAAPVLAGRSKPGTMSKNTIKPHRLSKGDTISVISPASGVSEDVFEESLQNLQDLGFQTKIGKYARGRSGFLSGTDDERLHDLHWAFRDNESKAVWCVRGGYGTSRILPRVDYNLIREKPKVFIGFSDITALHLAIYQKTGLVTFHGPNGASNYGDYTKDHITKTLMNPVKQLKIGLSDAPEGEDPALYQAKVIKPGRCRGRLIGGNLSLLAALTGTPFGLKDVKGKILFIEDVNERPYRIDRMLTQLSQTINMRSLAGIAIGVFTGADPEPAEPSQSLMEVLEERLGSLGIPVIYGLSFGHIRNQFTIPIGIRAEMNTSDSTLTFLEEAVG